MQKMSSYDLSIPLKRRFGDFFKVVFQNVLKTNYEFSGPFAYLKQTFRDLVQLAFFNTQNVENMFQWPFDIIDRRLIVMKKVAF
jgi:hypothetical protein